MATYLLAHDLGTSGNKATLFTSDGKLVKASVAHYKLYVSNGVWAEQDADDWWEAVCKTTRILLEDIDPKDVAAVSFSGQMMGCLCVDDTGTPLRRSLIWADMRASENTEKLKRSYDENRFYHLTGHRISASYSGPKLQWIKKNEPEVYSKTYKMLNAKDYILYKLTGNFVTEPSDASSTCLFDIQSLKWSDELASVFGLSSDKLPDVRLSIEAAGTVSHEASVLTGLLAGTPVICGGGDGVCAAVGSGVVKKGIANCCLGTSSWISLSSPEPIYDPAMTTFNFAHMVPGMILPCGTMQQGGGALSWAVNTFFPDGGDDVYKVVNEEASLSKPGSGGLLFLPYLIGERSPRWNDAARGCFIGLDLEHKRGDMLRSVMEGVAMNFNLILSAFRASGTDIDRLILLGGGARMHIWRNILSDVMNLPISIPNVLEEACSMGAAIAAGVGAGVFDSFDVINKFLSVSEHVEPDPKKHDSYAHQIEMFDITYKALMPVFDKL